MRTRFRTVVMVILLAALGACHSSYYVQVIDQNGDPVEGAEISYSTLNGNAYFFKRKGHSAITDSEGVARLIGGSTNNFYEVKKEGYQVDIKRQIHHRFGDWSLSEVRLKGHGMRNPLTIWAWRRGAEPQLQIKKGRLKIINDSRDCTLHLLSTPQGSIELIVNTELQWKESMGRYPYHLAGWRSSIRLSGAKIKGTNDFFMNEADLDGYVDEVMVSSEDRGPHTFFIRSDDGAVYGGGILDFDPASVPVADSARASTEGQSTCSFGSIHRVQATSCGEKMLVGLA